MSNFPVTDYSEYKGLERLDKGSYTDCGDGTPAKQTVICNVDELANAIGGGQANCATDFAGETLSAIKAVYYDGSALKLGFNNVTEDEAIVVGITKNAANINEQVQYQTSGRMDDSSFTFPINEYLFLDINGNITNVAPTTSGLYITKIGYSLGVGSIFIDIEQPTLIE